MSFLKWLLIIISVLLGILVGGWFGLHWWLTNNFDKILNHNPDKKYVFEYKNLTLDYAFTSVKLEELRILPVDSSSLDQVDVFVKSAEIRSFDWLHLLTNHQLDVRSIRFTESVFSIIISEKKKKGEAAEKQVQNFFSALLTGINLEEFSITDASLNALTSGNEKVIGVKQFSIYAYGIKTDSLVWQNTVPFKLDSITTITSGIFYKLNNYTELKVDTVVYTSAQAEFKISNLKLHYTKSINQVAKIVGKQTDLIEVQVRKLLIKNLSAQSSMYGNINVHAGKFEIDHLKMTDYRDKNMPRPPDVKKPMFTGLINRIPFPLKVDTLQIKNSDLIYIERGINKNISGEVRFAHLYGSIYNITNIPEIQKADKQMEADIIAKLNNAAPVKLRIESPYKSDRFKLVLQIGKFDFASLNKTLMGFASVQLSGQAEKIKLTMNTRGDSSYNTLYFDYSNLSLLHMETKGESEDKKFLKSIANMAIRHTNLPGTEYYEFAEYVSHRNIYRSPFNFIFQSVKEGVVKIVPTRTTQNLLLKLKKNKEKRKNKKH